MGFAVIIFGFNGERELDVVSVNHFGRESAAFAGRELKTGLVVVGESDFTQNAVGRIGGHDGGHRRFWLRGSFVATGRQESGQKYHDG